MRITKYIHSCLEIEKGANKILFDPGKFSFLEGDVKPEQFQDIEAIIITHKHPDHIDSDALKKILENNKKTVVLANSGIVKMLGEKEISAEVFEKGSRTIANFEIEAFDAPHEPILADEIPQNTAYLVDEKILHPGDSYHENLYEKRNTPILCLPTMAPWATEIETYKFAKEMSPEYIVPIHDGYSKDFFLEMRYQNYNNFFKKDEIKFQWMSKAGDYLEL